MNAAARPEDVFDWRAPDYVAIFRARIERLNRIRQNPKLLPALRAHYRDHPADFISDFGCTVDPRNVADGKPAFLPFVLMPKQREMIDWIVERWRNNESGIIEKSRDIGASWLAMALAVTLCLFNDNMMIGVGSAKEDKLDRSGDPDTLFYKARTFLQNLPPEFRDGFDIDKDSPYMRILFRASSSSITGEAGDQIGRGGRKAIFFLDESAHLERPKLVDASLLATTDCRIDLSSVNGMANSFAERRHSGRFQVFTFHYRDDLRRDDAWAQRKRTSTDPVIWAAEYELDYSASVEGIILPSEWVKAAVGAHTKLGITPSGIKRGALDIADLGRNLNAFVARHGVLVTDCTVWSGKESDLFSTFERAFLLCDQLGIDELYYDADGGGSHGRAPATRIADRRRKDLLREIEVKPHRGSDAVFDPDRIVPGTERTAKDLFQNFKAQSWWHCRYIFQNTFRAVNGEEYDSDAIISIDPSIPDVQKLCIELSQAQWKQSLTGKIMVDKTPDGMLSPDRADALVMAFAPRDGGITISDEVLNYEPDFEEDFA